MKKENKCKGSQIRITQNGFCRSNLVLCREKYIKQFYLTLTSFIFSYNFCHQMNSVCF